MKKRVMLLGLLLAAALCSCGFSDRGGVRLTEDAGRSVTIRITGSGGGGKSATTIEVSPGGRDGEIILRIDLDQ